MESFNPSYRNKEIHSDSQKEIKEAIFYEAEVDCYRKAFLNCTFIRCFLKNVEETVFKNCLFKENKLFFFEEE